MHMIASGETVSLLMIQAESKEKAKYKGPVDCIRQLYKEGGIRWIYKGTAATFLRDIHGSGVYFATYEVLQRSLTPEGESRNDLSPLRTLVAGGVAGLANWIVAIPPDFFSMLFSFFSCFFLFHASFLFFLCFFIFNAYFFLSFSCLFFFLFSCFFLFHAFFLSFSCLFLMHLSYFLYFFHFYLLTFAPMKGESQKIAHVVQRLLKKEGFKALYIGSTPLLMRAFIGNAACLLSYEATIRILNYFVPNL
ncbi:SLC25A20_29 [Acanthosepion pharaonis]|uniref:SLC25A20_29 n=1 Tax=Acanthosepion pharaonis TaxID=158019 RepID=A0A812CHE1_ACAPH|nr:SLC25A20_29 [Sepia pharaonis]